MVLDFYDMPMYRKEISYFHEDLPILTYHAKAFDAQQLFLKRMLDILGALVGLLLLTVLYPLIAVAIKLDSPGPVFFRQKRVGYNGRLFTCRKFRSMVASAEKQKLALSDRNEMNGALFKIRDDPRVTRVGRFLRRTSLDEFPQFWNVLVGEMSLVGTRPPTRDEVEQYENWHRRRISIKPGLTGLWQVSGRSQIGNFDEIVRLDLKYIDNWSLWLDLKIILKTVYVVFTRVGSY
jgi:exopolysaccharide biosynthesis polyprenyl glycosylphosphotransferase